MRTVGVLTVKHTPELLPVSGLSAHTHTPYILGCLPHRVPGHLQRDTEIVGNRKTELELLANATCDKILLLSENSLRWIKMLGPVRADAIRISRQSVHVWSPLTEILREPSNHCGHVASWVSDVSAEIYSINKINRPHYAVRVLINRFPLERPS